MNEIKNIKDGSLIDVRESYEFASGHILGSLNIPLSSIPYRLDEIKMMNKPIVLYCKTGNRSGQAMNYLNSIGITDVHNAGSVEDVAKMIHPLSMNI